MNNMNFPLMRGKATRQPHVALPEGTYEEEHGREGFFGRVSHLYHTNPPTGWSRIEGPLRPHAFYLKNIEPTDMKEPKGQPTPILYNADLIMMVSRRNFPTKKNRQMKTEENTRSVSNVSAK